MFIRQRGSENSPATTLNSPAKFRWPHWSSLEGKCFSEWPDSPVTLKYPPATSVLNENPVKGTHRTWIFARDWSSSERVRPASTETSKPRSRSTRQRGRIRGGIEERWKESGIPSVGSRGRPRESVGAPAAGSGWKLCRMALGQRSRRVASSPLYDLRDRASVLRCLAKILEGMS